MKIKFLEKVINGFGENEFKIFENGKAFNKN